jgi:hypothetical protein
VYTKVCTWAAFQRSSRLEPDTLPPSGVYLRVTVDRVESTGAKGTVSAAMDRKARPKGDESDESTVAGPVPADQAERVRQKRMKERQAENW